MNNSLVVNSSNNATAMPIQQTGAFSIDGIMISDQTNLMPACGVADARVTNLSVEGREI